MFSNILLATDGSEGALHAAQAAVELARKFGSHVTVLSVCKPPIDYGTALGVPLIEADGVLTGEWQKCVLEEAGRVFVEHQVDCRPRQEFGSPGEVIACVAQEEGSDLIIVGSRGLGAFQRTLLGSVSDHVTHHAHCPVLVVR